MRILALETSCDETGAAIVEKKNNSKAVKVLSNVLASSASLQAQFGGVIPERAAREQIKAIIPVIIQALVESKFRGSTPNSPYEKFLLANTILKETIDAVAVAHGPGLISSLLVGVETAKTLSFALSKPIVPVHHLLAHLSANFIRGESSIVFPFIGLIVSGGHTDLLMFESYSKFKWLGGTRDDAAGEALDKIGRLLNLSYPAGHEIEERAAKVEQTTFAFQSPLINSKDFDFSFSGLKAEVARFVSKKHLTVRLINEVCHATQAAIIKVLIKKTIRSAKLYKVNNILLGGGVSANQKLVESFKSSIINNKLSMQIFSPEKKFATDNAAMIGAHALLNFRPIDWRKINAEPELYFD